MITNSVQPGVFCYALYGNFDGVNLPALQQYIFDSADVLSYWNHLPLLYVIKTRADLTYMAEKFQPFFDGKFFIVMEVNPDNVNGFLPMQAWQWFKTPAPPAKVPPYIASLAHMPR